MFRNTQTQLHLNPLYINCVYLTHQQLTLSFFYVKKGQKHNSTIIALRHIRLNQRPIHTHTHVHTRQNGQELSYYIPIAPWGNWWRLSGSRNYSNIYIIRESVGFHKQRISLNTALRNVYENVYASFPATLIIQRRRQFLVRWTFYSKYLLFKLINCQFKFISFHRLKCNYKTIMRIK